LINRLFGVHSAIEVIRSGERNVAGWIAADQHFIDLDELGDKLEDSENVIFVASMGWERCKAPDEVVKMGKGARLTAE
jgi:hypothetical protein